jgi:transposase, IS30 family
MNHQPSKRRFTYHQQEMMWQLWSQGKSLSEIGRQLNKHAGSVFCYLQKSGGIKPATPKRSAKDLSLLEREEISRGISAHLSLSAIARNLNRAASTITRKINRNGGLSKYRGVAADRRAWMKAKRPKSCKLKNDVNLCTVVSDKLASKWSPEQVAGWLKQTYPDSTARHISHETIYKSLFIQARGALKKELLRELRTQRVMRQSKHFNTKGNARGGIIDAVSIHDRPEAINDRMIPGHWEGDLICGTQQSYIATLVERTSRYTLLVKLSGNDTQSVVGAITRRITNLPEQLKKSLTWDRGMELAQHKQFTIDTNIKVYFCDPKSPWQKGTNENTNKLLRQYMPKKTNLSVYSQEQLDTMAKELNDRPRKTLNFLAPAQKISVVLQ